MNLAIPSFVIALVSITLQLFDAFPKHREARQAVVLMTLGFFVGTVSTTLMNAHYIITGSISASYILLFIVITAAVTFGLLAVFLNDPAKRDVASVVAACFGFGALATGFAVAMANSPAIERMSLRDRLTLANTAEARGDWAEAISQLKTEEEILEDDTLKQALQRRIARDQAMQSRLIAQ